MSTVLVSGACGLIGEKTCSGLLKKGFRVLAVDKAESEYNKNKENYLFFEAEQNDRDKYTEIFKSEPIDVFIHLACSADNDFDNIIDDRCMGLSRSCDRFIYKLAVEAQVSVIIMLSSSQVYEVKKSREPVREGDDTKPSSNYGKMKLESEKALSFHIKKVKNLRCCVMRTAQIYTKDFYLNLKSKIIDPKDNVAFLYRTGDYGFHFCCLHNLVEFAASFINADPEVGVTGFYNIADLHPVTAEEIVNFMREYHRLGPVVQRNFATDNLLSKFSSKKMEKMDYRYLDIPNLLNNNRLDTNKAKRLSPFRWNLGNTK